MNDKNESNLGRTMDSLSRYVVHIDGSCYMKKLFENDPGQAPLTITTMEDAAYFLELRENSMDVWDQVLKLKSKETSYDDKKKVQDQDPGRDDFIREEEVL